jgi:hypothetical protein
MSVEPLYLSVFKSMPILALGPIELRTYSNVTGRNWTDFEFAFVTGRTKAGFAERETALRTSFKSDHLLEAFGEDNPDDQVSVNGTTYLGKTAAGFDGKDHVLTAQQVSAKAEYLKACKEAKAAAQRAANLADGIDPAILVDCTVTAEA